jgi:hypothetical protein
MKEILGLSDDPPARKRWFHDDYFDLFVWESDGEVMLFQLCYGNDTKERALVWDRKRGFFHDGSIAGAPSSEEVAARFEAAAQSLPEPIRRTVKERIGEFAGQKDAVPSRRKRFRRAEWQR